MAETTVLIIDDNISQQAKLEEILNPLPCTIIRTDTAAKALDIMRYTEVAVIILDYGLKGLDLFEFMHTIRQDHHGEDAHVIITLDKDHKRYEVAETYKSGAVDYIEKPFQPETIRSMVKVFVKLFHKKKRVRSLLLNILPREIAMELETSGKVKPKRYAMASVLFTDFVSFSHRTREMSAVELVNTLDSYFAQFDRTITRYHLEKIKTIGDAYMSVGGVPEKRKENPILSALAALEIANHMEKMKHQLRKSGRKAWELRIGIHSGPLVAGVIGKKKFAYDVWGDTVNIASRICSNCEPGKVNISAATFEKIKDYFDCHYRGQIEGKNIGHVGMYYITGLKPEYSIGGKGTHPNKLMKQVAGLIFVQYERLKDYIIDRLTNELPANLYYHGVHHTVDVLQAVMVIGKEEGLDEEEQLMLNTAALLHDCGYLYTYHNNEELAVKMARKILPDYGYTSAQIKLISGIIRTTKVRSIPKTRLQQIMNDADYDYLGRKDYDDIAETLYKEMKEQDIKLSRKEWVEKQIHFLEKHIYYTESAINLRNKQKTTNLGKLKRKRYLMK
ncbi:MAG: response regulator [Flavobacteriales bacterium]|nr:response regulator [Flavobacteriales bacterium]